MRGDRTRNTRRSIRNGERLLIGAVHSHKFAQRIRVCEEDPGDSRTVGVILRILNVIYLSP